MSFIRKLFKGNKQPEPEPVTKKKEKTSFLGWLCASKPRDLQQQQSTHLNQLNTKDSIIRKSFVSTNTNIHPQSKIMQRLSFAQDRGQFPQDQLLKGQLINIFELRIQKIEDLLGDNGLYGMINSDQPLMNLDQQIGIWLKIGKSEQINSLAHIKPYYFDKIFIFHDQLSSEYTISDILNSRQNIYLKLHPKTPIQTVIDSYENQFTRQFAFKLMADCFNKLKVTVYRTKRNDVWVVFNEQADPSVYIDQFLGQLGFDQQHEQYSKLKQEISTGLTLQQYIDMIEHKEKLQSKYQGQNVAEYIKTKFLQKISRNGITPRNDSPRTAQKQKSSDSEKQEQCHRYVLSMTANTLPKQRIQQMYTANQLAPRGDPKNQKNSFEEEIFQFNVYKDEKEQEAKRVAISKERKKRSRSQDISVNDLHNADLDETDFFDKID